MDSKDSVCRCCGLQTSSPSSMSCSSLSPSSSKAAARATPASRSRSSLTSSFITSLRNPPVTWAKLHVLLWTYVLALTLVSSTVTGRQKFLQQPDNVSVSRGRVVVLNCTILNRVGLVQWTQNKVALGADRTLPGYPRYSMIGVETHRANGETIGEWNLQIVDVRLEDDGEYQCQAGATSTVPGNRTRSAFLTVVIPPEQPTIDHAPTIPIVLHQATNITCRANNGKPAADITWYMDGRRITEKVYSRSHPRPEQKFVDTVGMVTINASKSDSGRQIECRAVNQFMDRPYTTSATLDVRYAPEISMSMNMSKTIREYNYIRFTCAGVANPPDITWRWFRNNQMLEGETTNMLNIRQITYDYDGDTIACTASNRVGRTRREMTLKVKFGPKITHMEAVVGADIHSAAELTCTADGNPTPHIIWTRKDRGSPTPRTLSTSSTYRIDVVTRASFGVYVCTASSAGFPDASKEVLLLQNGKPTIRSEEKQYAVRDEQGRLECVAHSVPKPDRMVWLKDGMPIDDSVNSRFAKEEKDLLYGRTSILHIYKVHKDDFGSYNCNVVNAYGSDNAILTLVEKTVPPLPYIIGGAVGGVAVLFILALACVFYLRYKREESGSVLESNSVSNSNSRVTELEGSTTDTDSSADKKRKDADSPSTLMDQWRQDYNKKDFYRYSADYDELNYKDHTGNNNAYGCLEPSEQSHRDANNLAGGGYSSRAMTPLERYEAVYGPSGYSMSSFRGRDRTMMDMTDAKLATDV